MTKQAEEKEYLLGFLGGGIQPLKPAAEAAAAAASPPPAPPLLVVVLGSSFSVVSYSVSSSSSFIHYMINNMINYKVPVFKKQNWFPHGNMRSRLILNQSFPPSDYHAS